MMSSRIKAEQKMQEEIIMAAVWEDKKMLSSEKIVANK
jgi:hypothetical protein